MQHVVQIDKVTSVNKWHCSVYFPLVQCLRVIQYFRSAVDFCLRLNIQKGMIMEENTVDN